MTKKLNKPAVSPGERNREIIAAVRAGEPTKQIAERYGLGAERIRQIAADAGVKPGVPRVTQCWCGRELRQETRGLNGFLVDVCEKHDMNITGAGGNRIEHETQMARSPTNFDPAAARSCRVAGCVGLLDGAGKCACCERRAAWVLENLPGRPCKICQGPMKDPTNRQEFCAACAPLSKQLQKRTKAAEAVAAA